MLFNGKRLEMAGSQSVFTDLAFWPGVNKNTFKFADVPRGLVVHWTGAENDGNRVVDTLLKRELSIHFTIEKTGEIVQRADLATRCAHAGIGNRFWGVEIVGRGFARPEDVRGSDLRDRTELDWAEPRDVYRDEIDGKRVNMAAFYPAQIKSALLLCEMLCAGFNVPRLMPEVVTKKPSELYAIKLDNGKSVEPAFNRKPYRWQERARKFEGILGHFHLHSTKCDPGTQVFRALWANGFNSPGMVYPSWESDRRFA